MTKIIINPEQLKAINEAAMAFTYDGGKPNDFQTQLSNFTMKNPTAKNSVIQGVNTSDTVSMPSTTEIEKSQEAQQVIIPPEGGQNNALAENRYTKRQVELGRILEMRRTGKVFSKKQLDEMFRNDKI